MFLDKSVLTIPSFGRDSNYFITFQIGFGSCEWETPIDPKFWLFLRQAKWIPEYNTMKFVNLMNWCKKVPRLTLSASRSLLFFFDTCCFFSVHGNLLFFFELYYWLSFLFHWTSNSTPNNDHEEHQPTKCRNYVSEHFVHVTARGHTDNESDQNDQHRITKCFSGVPI